MSSVECRVSSWSVEFRMQSVELLVFDILHSALDIWRVQSVEFLVFDILHSKFDILISDPRVFATSSLRRVDDEGAFTQSNAC